MMKKMIIIFAVGMALAGCNISNQQSNANTAEAIEVGNGTAEVDKIAMYIHYLQNTIEEALSTLEEIDECGVKLEYEGDSIISAYIEIKRSDLWENGTEAEVYAYVTKAANLSEEKIFLSYIE